MSWGQNKSFIARAAFAGALLSGVMGASAASAQEALIVKSTVADYAVGSKLDEKAEITLKDGDVVTVLTKKGARVMRGPGVFVVGASPKNRRARFTQLTRERVAQRSQTGGVRGTGPGGAEETRPLNPNLYYLDVDGAGPVCLRDLSVVNLWRPYAVEPTTYTLSEAVSDGAETPETEQVLSLSVPFEEREKFAEVQATRFALKDGETYTITAPGTGRTTSITVVDLGEDIKEASALADVLFQKGCLVQFELMAQRLASDG